MHLPRRLLALLFVLAVPGIGAAEVPSFRNDVMAAVSKAGCNLGTCHGNKTGKGGFRLSLRGQDPADDFATLTRRDDGRRVNLMNPADSLLLLKPAMTLAHEGGRRFRPDDLEYRLIHDWIAAGMPADNAQSPTLTSLDVGPLDYTLAEPHWSVKLTVWATFSDGSRRDVTPLAVLEPSSLHVTVAADGTVTGDRAEEATVVVRFLDQRATVRLAFVADRPNFAWTGPPPENFIDAAVFAKLQRLKINPSPAVDDATFAHRAWLDLLGVVPPAAEARAFVADPDPSKRTRLVDQLLSRPGFAVFWGLKWADLLRAEEKSLDSRGVKLYVEWIRSSIGENKPLDQFARELLAARGSTYEVAPANFYRAMRDPITRSESVAQLFLGVRLQCAQCHNHPFDAWTQEDYYGWANNFSQIDYEIKENKRKDKNDKHEFVGEQIIKIDDQQKPVKHPDTGKPVPPRFLDQARTAPAADADRLEQLAAWITGPDNPQFARLMVNRVWAELLGRGIVDPVDDFKATNPPANPELLDALAADFVSHKYDLRHLIHTIMASRVYEAAAETNATNATDESNFSHAIPRRLTAEQLLDSMAQITGASPRFGDLPRGTRAAELVGIGTVYGRRGAAEAGDRFLKLFGKPPRLQTCDCERSDDTTLGQAFQLVSGAVIDEMLRADDNTLTELAQSDRPPAGLVDDLYWAALTRAPTDTERGTAVAHFAAVDNRRRAAEDIAWALLTSTEFLLRR